MSKPTKLDTYKLKGVTVALSMKEFAEVEKQAATNRDKVNDALQVMAISAFNAAMGENSDFSQASRVIAFCTGSLSHARHSVIQWFVDNGPFAIKHDRNYNPNDAWIAYNGAGERVTKRFKLDKSETANNWNSNALEVAPWDWTAPKADPDLDLAKFEVNAILTAALKRLQKAEENGRGFKGGKLSETKARLEAAIK